MRALYTGARVYQNGRFENLDIAVEDGVTVGIFPRGSSVSYDTRFELHNSIAIPGLADVHVHLREPGFSYKETIARGTRAAAAGGYTVVCAMPNLDPPPDTVEHLRRELDLIARDAVIPVLPYAAITRGQLGRGELADIGALAPLAFGFSDDGRGIQDRDLMRRAMEEIHARGGFIAAHCEDEALVRGGYVHDGVYAAAHGHKGICSESEWGQIARDLELVAETGCRYHVCHISSKESVDLIRKAKAKGLPVTCETAPHYLLLCDQDLQEEGRFKMNPPLRDRADKEALLAGILDGTVDIIATDHAPHSAEEKGKGLPGSAMGVVGLETAFPVLYTGLVQKGVISLEKLVDLMSDAPRRIFSLPGGAIQVGRPLDMAVIDLGEEYTVDPEEFWTMGRSTPFAGWTVRGRVRMTVADGRTVWKRD